MAAIPSSSFSRGLNTTKQPRIGFKKSRAGCFACKRRKVKCQEMQPRPCHNCTKLQLECVYPAANIKDNKPQWSNMLGATILSGYPAVFSATDLRLFHHFLCNAYPHLPLGSDQVWITDIASYSHTYNFLIHALLGMAASHLTLTSNSDLQTVAISHRVHAVKGLNDALSRPPQSQADGDALIATCYALALQSSYMGSSVGEFLTMLRGKNLLATQERRSRYGSVFATLSEESQLAIASERLSCAPVLNMTAIKSGKESMERLSFLCSNDFVADKIAQYLLGVFYACDLSSREAYFKFWNLGTRISTLPQIEFQRLLDSDDPIMQLLLAHYAGLSVLMYPVKAMEWHGRDLGKPNRTTIYMFDDVIDSIPQELRAHLEWPKLMISSAGLLKLKS